MADPLDDNTLKRPTTVSAYDANGNIVSVTDPLGHVTSNTYDAMNRLVATTDAAGIQVRYEYDPVGNRTKVTDGKDQVTLFGYDGLKRNTSVIDSAGHTTTFGYDGQNKISRTDGLGHITQYAYDYRNRLTGVSYTDRAGDNRTYSYDLAGNMLGVSEPGKNGVADAAYTYDALKRIVTETSNSVTHTYSYDLAGNRLKTIYGNNGKTILSSYDAFNRLSTMSESGRVTGYGYDAVGNIAVKTAPNGDRETATFDLLNRTTSQTAISGTTMLYEYLYEHDLAGNVTKVGENYAGGLNNRIVNNSYDAINRLLTEAVSGSNAVTTAYVYDAANNRTSKVVTGGSNGGTTGYTYNALNQLTQYSDSQQSVALTYDANGNRAARTVTGGTAAGADTYSYDYENRLVGLVKGTGLASGTYAYIYDYRTRRVVRDESAAGGVTTNVVFSGGLSVQEYAAGSTYAAVEYIRGSDYGGGVGGILYTLRGSEASFTHENRRGDVIAKTDANGVLTYQASYEAYGTRTQENGSTQDRQKANTKDEDPSGLLNEGQRYRDLETGGFITQDPAGFVDGPNLYTYVKQNPWTSFDPEGLSPMAGAEIYIAAKVAEAQGEDIGQAIREAHASQRIVGSMAAGTLVGTAVAVPLIMAAPEALAATVGTRMLVAAVSGGAGGYAANGTTNKLEGQPFNKNAGQAIAVGAATGVVFQGVAEAGKGLVGETPTPETPPAGSSPVGPTANETVRVQHYSSEERIAGYMENQEITSSSDLVYGVEAKTPGKPMGTGEAIKADTGAKHADKAIEFDVKKSEMRKNEVGDVTLPKPVKLENRNPTVIDVPKEEQK